MTNNQLKSILEARKVFKEKEIKAITDMNYDFKQVINYNIFMKLDRLNNELKKITNGLASLKA